jgi:hypothetical protein
VKTIDAKDFLVQQTLEQAAMEKVPVSALEKRMMYFVENDPTSCADPLALNQEFENECDTAAYEAKISSLLHHAFQRLQSTDPQKTRHWNQAIRMLSSGDHYLPVLWRQPASDFPLRGPSTPLRDSFTLLVAGLVVASVLVAAIFVAAKYGHTLNGFLPNAPPGLVRILLIGLAFVLAVAAWLFFNWVRLAWTRRRIKPRNTFIAP